MGCQTRSVWQGSIHEVEARGNLGPHIVARQALGGVHRTKAARNDAMHRLPILRIVPVSNNVWALRQLSEHIVPNEHMPAVRMQVESWPHRATIQFPLCHSRRRRDDVSRRGVGFKRRPTSSEHLRPCARRRCVPRVVRVHPEVGMVLRKQRHHPLQLCGHHLVVRIEEGDVAVIGAAPDAAIAVGAY